MPIDPTNSLAAPQATTAPAAQPQGGMGQETFMKLLVAELKNQDPLNPMEAREMVTQLSELTSVEKLAAIDHRLQVLEVGTAGLANTQAAGLAGKLVTANADRLILGELGGAEGAFNLSGRAEKVTIAIRNAAGRTVRTLSLNSTFPGTHTVSWDGKDDMGRHAGAGVYTMSVSAEDAGGLPVVTSSQVRGVVGHVSYENGYPELIIGNARVLLGDVVSIAQ